MSVNMVHTISDHEFNAGYINLGLRTDRRPDMQFPPAGTEIIVVDQDKRRFHTRMHSRWQIWSLTPWYVYNQVTDGTTVNIRYDPSESSDDLPVVHLDRVGRQLDGKASTDG